MGARRAVGGMVRACHAEPTLAVTAVTCAFAVAVGRGAGAAWVAAAVLAGQLSVGWSNDFIDRHRDAAAGRRDKPIPAGDVPARVVGAAAAAALAAAVPLSFASGWRAALAHLVGVGAAWSYNLGVKATPLSPLPYAVGFGALPAFVVLGLPGHPVPPWWLVTACALLGVGAHFANVLPDLADDIRLGVVGLPHRLGRPASTLVCGALLLVASAVLAVGPRSGRTSAAGPGAGPADGPSSGPGMGLGGIGPVGIGGLLAAVVLLVAGLAWSRRPDSRAPFRVAICVAVLDVALLLARGNLVR